MSLPPFPKGFVIAIDGPVASGKGTIAPLLAKKLNGCYLYTGAMYRSLALACLEEQVDVSQIEQVLSLIKNLKIELINGRVILNGRDVTERIKREDVANVSSKVALITKVREQMVTRQQEIGEEMLERGKIVVAEGRDSATRIFPKAAFKLFLTATPEVRAKRRIKQIEDRGEQADFAKVLEDLEIRDEQDTQRETDPLATEPEKIGYFVLDSSELNQEQTIELILEELKRRKLI